MQTFINKNLVVKNVLEGRRRQDAKMINCHPSDKYHAYMHKDTQFKLEIYTVHSTLSFFLYVFYSKYFCCIGNENIFFFHIISMSYEDF